MTTIEFGKEDLETNDIQQTVVHKTVLAFKELDIVVIKSFIDVQWVVVDIDIENGFVVIANKDATETLFVNRVRPELLLHINEISLITINKKWKVCLN